MKQNLGTKKDRWYVAAESRKKQFKKGAIKTKGKKKENFTYKVKEERIKIFFSVYNPTPRSNGSALVLVAPL